MIQVENLHKSFDGIPVLEGISTTFQKGITNLIIGASGSGKTVFLKSLLGIHTPDSGEIYYSGLRLNEMSKNQYMQLRQEMGMVFQGSALFDSKNIGDNVRFPLEMFTRLTQKEMNHRVDEVLERVNLHNVNSKYPSEISGGMQKRVAIARAIVMNPKYLFCDEPNSGLDPNTAILIDELIQEITREYQMTTIINTHDMNSVMQIGESIVFLKNGFKEWEGTHKEIFKTDNEAVTNFVYSSALFKKVRQMYIIEDQEIKE